MPVRAGLELARRIAEDERIAVPVVGLTAHGFEGVAEARAAGLVGEVVTKWARSSRLFEAVAAAAATATVSVAARTSCVQRGRR